MQSITGNLRSMWGNLAFRRRDPLREGGDNLTRAENFPPEILTEGARLLDIAYVNIAPGASTSESAKNGILGWAGADMSIKIASVKKLTNDGLSIVTVPS